MRLSPAALAVTAALFWGGSIVVIGGTNILVPGYGDAVLSLVASIYPGYDHAGTVRDLALGATYAFLDGLVGGFLFALVYNAAVRLLARGPSAAEAPASRPAAASPPKPASTPESSAPPDPTA